MGSPPVPSGVGMLSKLASHLVPGMPACGPCLVLSTLLSWEPCKVPAPMPVRKASADESLHLPPQVRSRVELVMTVVGTLLLG